MQSATSTACDLPDRLRAAGEITLEVRGDAAVLTLPDGSTYLISLQDGATLLAAGAVLPQVAIIGVDLKSTFAVLAEYLVTKPARFFDLGLAGRVLAGGRRTQPHNLPTGPALRARAAELRHELWVRGLEETSALEHSVLPAVVEMELAGVPVDVVRWQEVLRARQAEREELVASIKDKLGINGVSERELREALSVVTGVQLRGTGADSLAPYLWLSVVRQTVRVNQLSAFLHDLGPKVLRAAAGDGRARASIDQLGCATGRFTTTNPNLLGMPRDAEVRACVAAPPGKKLLVLDYRAIELRVAAEVSGDERLRELFARGGDPHRATAAAMLGKPEEEVAEEERARAKPINFGCLFGAGPEGIVGLAQKNFGVGMSVDEARHFQESFFGAYPALKRWQEEVRSEVAPVVRTLGGRLRYMDGGQELFTARLASVVQGTAADGIKRAVAIIYPQLRQFGAQLVLVVHDELLVEVPEENAAALLPLVERAMVDGMATYLRHVPVTVKARICNTWAEA